MSNVGSWKRKILTLEDRVKVTMIVTNGDSRGLSQPVWWLERPRYRSSRETDDIRRQWEAGKNAEKYVKSRKCVYQDMDDAVWAWFHEARARNISRGRLFKRRRQCWQQLSATATSMHRMAGWCDGRRATTSVVPC